MIENHGQKDEFHHGETQDPDLMSGKGFPYGCQINGQVAEEEINHQAIKGKCLKLRSEVGKNNGGRHG